MIELYWIYVSFNFFPICFDQCLKKALQNFPADFENPSNLRVKLRQVYSIYIQLSPAIWCSRPKDPIEQFWIIMDSSIHHHKYHISFGIVHYWVHMTSLPSMANNVSWQVQKFQLCRQGAQVLLSESSSHLTGRPAWYGCCVPSDTSHRHASAWPKKHSAFPTVSTWQLCLKLINLLRTLQNIAISIRTQTLEFSGFCFPAQGWFSCCCS